MPHLRLLALAWALCSVAAAQPEPLFTLPAPESDLRTMLRRYMVRRAVEQLEQSQELRRQAIREGRVAELREQVRKRLRATMGDLPFGARGGPLNVRAVSQHDRKAYRIENVLFESLPGWEVNATVYLPPADRFPPPWIPVIMPVGHSGKQMENYQVPAQVLARCGYLVVLFDPPGLGEKRAGNDHFRDGVRAYLTGETSQRYFVMDALRAVDYAATRADVEMRRGVGMTGVSGGGFTTLYAAVLDDRVKASGPSCFAAPEAHHPIRNGYSLCPETEAFGLYRDGLDAANLLLATAPTPTLFMAGRDDEVFKAEWTRSLAEEAARAYQSAGAGERFRFFLDEGGHAYTIRQALEFVRWMDRWVGARPDRQLPAITRADVEMLAPEMLHCRPRQEPNMVTLARAQAGKRSGLPVREAARKLAGSTSAAVETASRGPYQLWQHELFELFLSPEKDITLPATFLRAPGQRAGAVLYFDDRGRWTDLASGGLLANLARFTQDATPKPALLTVDLRGWGDTKPTPAPYEIAGWGAPDRWFSYVGAAIGDSVAAMRIRDGLAALEYLRARPEVDPARIIVGGHGAGGVVALHVAAIDARVRAVFASEIPAGFAMLAGAPSYAWDQEIFMPNVLRHYDLDELAASIKAPVLIVNPLDALKRPLTEPVFQKGRVTVRMTHERRPIQDWVNSQW